MPTEPNEIRAEVERRKQLARDLKIREVLWDLEKTFKHYRSWLNDDPQFAARLIYPGIVPSEDETRFSIEQATFQLIYEHGTTSSNDDYSWGGSREGFHEIDTTRGTLTLRMNSKVVFEFAVTKTTEWNRFGPVYHDVLLGEITRFIEGEWVTEVAAFRQRVKAQYDSVWEERNAPREAKEIEDLKKRFGL